MIEFEGYPGASKLAKVISGRIKKEGESPLILDFGEIQGNGSLITNTFPIPIPLGDYSVCRHVGGLSFRIDGNTEEDFCIAELPAIKPGDRVLVAWVQSEAVVVDVIVTS